VDEPNPDEYQPIDIGEACNVGTDFVRSTSHWDPLSDPSRNFAAVPPSPAIGMQWFRGLPFAVASDPARCFVGLGTPDQPVRTVRIEQKARRLIFAHALLDSRLLIDDIPGRTVATYVVRFADGSQERLPIRERFEVAVVPTEWGGQPFLALPDRSDDLMPRDVGSWQDIGFRQAEVTQGEVCDYYLWSWENPRPDDLIASVTVEPGGPRFILAAITASIVAEDPFVRTAPREVLMTLQGEWARRPLPLKLKVDRGSATYPYPLPARADSFLDDPRKGWGEPANLTSSPAYVRVAANPSATVRVLQASEELAAVRWRDLEEKGAVEHEQVRLELIDRGRNWVGVSVVDDETDQPVPCRVHFRSPEGIPYQPHGHPDHVGSDFWRTWHLDVGGDVRLGGTSYAYIDGRCQGWLPRGDVIADVARGFEYEPLRTRVTIAPGQRELTLRLHRWIDLRAERWFSGDSHVHFLSTQGAHLEAQGEDLQVVNLLQAQWGHLYTNTEEFTGRPSLSPDGRSIVFCSQENRQHMLGHLVIWGLRQPVMPWSSDGPSEAELAGTLEETLSHWADRSHAAGGTVVLAHLPNPNGEPAVLVATGRADAVEMIDHRPHGHLDYYRYLNNGYRLPLVGGTDKMSSQVPVGLYRTYAFVPEDQEFNYENWTAAVRAGRTFLSGGPLMRLSVDGARIGDTIRLARGGGEVEVEATADSIFRINCLQIIERGKVVASTESDRGARHLVVRARLRISENSWIAARCGGPGYEFDAITHHDEWRRGIFAHTSPIYIACGEEWRMFDQHVAQYMLTLVDGGLAYLRSRAPYDRAGSATHAHGEDDHRAYLERPFYEARATLERRIREGVLG
jgi:hypothetical protein